MSHLGAEEGVVALLEGEASRGADLAVLPERVARDGRAGGALHVLEQQYRRLPEVRGVGAGGHAEVEPLVRYAPHPAPAQRVHRLVRAHLRRDHEVVRAQHRCSRPNARERRRRAQLAEFADEFRVCLARDASFAGIAVVCLVRFRRKLGRCKLLGGPVTQRCASRAATSGLG